MPYQVFFVEDEIVTREGIRDNVDWQAQGFALCGEAPDGEIALPLLVATRPDVLITDIKMPFMDGLQLARIVRERMPRTKIVVLSGHDEFEYAQQAIKVGVSEYLLKPVTVQNMHDMLRRVAAQLDRERQEQAALDRVHQQVEGLVGSAPANDRYAGFRDVLGNYPGMKIITSDSGDFTRAKGKEVMAGSLRRYGRQITALYAHNDDMAMRAIQAIQEFGLHPGTDIKIVSVDATRNAFQAMISGDLNATIECNPLLGPQF